MNSDDKRWPPLPHEYRPETQADRDKRLAAASLEQFRRDHPEPPAAAREVEPTGVTVLREWEYGPLTYYHARVRVASEEGKVAWSRSRVLLFLVPFTQGRQSIQLQFVTIE